MKSERGKSKSTVKPDKSKVKPSKVTIPFRATEAFRDALQAKVKEEGRDVSKVIRRLLRQHYPDLPEE